MAFKTILTVVDPELGDSDLKLAAALCEEIEAHLAVLVIALAAPPPVGAYVATLSAPWLEERQADVENLERRVAEASTLLAASPVSSDLSSEYPETAWADEIIGRRARYADVTVLGPAMLSRGTLKSKIAEGVLFSSGKPLLLIPKDSTPTLRPKRVMVGWDGRIESSRAVTQSLDLLVRAEEVRLVLVDPVEGEDMHGSEPGADAAMYLARHGVKVTVDRLPSQGWSVASVLHRHAVDAAADLLVLGAYGHSRLHEWIFGGVTRSMLEEPPLPVLLAR